MRQLTLTWPLVLIAEVWIGLLFDEFASTLLVAIHSDDWGRSSNFHGRAEIFSGQNSALDMLAAAASASATQRRADFQKFFLVPTVVYKQTTVAPFIDATDKKHTLSHTYRTFKGKLHSKIISSDMKDFFP